MSTDLCEDEKLYFLRDLVDVFEFEHSLICRDIIHVITAKFKVCHYVPYCEGMVSNYRSMRIEIKEILEYCDNNTIYKNYKKILYPSNFKYDGNREKYISIDDYKNPDLKILRIVAYIELIRFYFNVPSDDVDEIKAIIKNKYIVGKINHISILNKLEEKIKKIRKIRKMDQEKIKELEQRLEKLEKLLNNMLCYSPDAPGYDKAEKEFNELK